MTYVLHFFNLRLRLRSTAEGQSFSGPNIRLRPKVKIAPTVQHCRPDEQTPSLQIFDATASFILTRFRLELDFAISH